jgi:nucleotide-binding universal stress UspA family protein
VDGPVLVGVDGSEGSRTALRWASGFAESTGRPLAVVHTWRYPEKGGIDPIWPAPSDPAEVDDRIERSLRRICSEELGSERAGTTRVASLRGDAAGALIDEARRVQASLLVVGSRGLGGFRSLMLGSVGRTVLDHATCPVAVVRGETSVTGPILVATDSSAGAARAVAWAADAAAALHTSVVLVRAYESPSPNLPRVFDRELRDEARATLDRAVADLELVGVPSRAIMVDGDPREAVTEVVAREHPRLVVAGIRGIKRSTTLLGSVASHLAYHLPGVVVLTPP